MNVKQAATELGVTPQQVRWLVRNRKLNGSKRKSANNQHGYEYDISQAAVNRYARTDRRPGRKAKARK